MSIVETPTCEPGWVREMWEKANPPACSGDPDVAAADAAALWLLAEMSTPPDIVEFGERHKIPELAKHLWQGAFVAGWRARHKATAGKAEKAE